MRTFAGKGLTVTDSSDSFSSASPNEPVQLSSLEEGYRIVLDLPSRSPALGFDQYARVLKDIIVKSEPQLAIGVFGEWGVGKTTLMLALKERLRVEEHITVQFNAWRYEREEHLIV